MSSCGADTHLLFSGHSSLDDRCERHKRASRAWSARWPARPKGRIESEPRGPSQLREVRGVAWGRTHRTVPITNRHDSPWFESVRSHFALFWSFWLAISEPGWTSPQKVPTGVRLKSTRPSEIRAKSAAPYIKKVSPRRRKFSSAGAVGGRLPKERRGRVV